MMGRVGDLPCVEGRANWERRKETDSRRNEQKMYIKDEDEHATGGRNCEEIILVQKRLEAHQSFGQ
jgi:hypothetical protein